MIQRYDVTTEQYITDVPGPNRWCKSEEVEKLEALLEEAQEVIEALKAVTSINGGHCYLMDITKSNYDRMESFLACVKERLG